MEAKVDIAVGKASDRIIERIETLRTEVHELNIRLAAVETKLGMKNEIREQIRNRFIDYAFKASWLLSAAIVSVIASALFLYFHHI